MTLEGSVAEDLYSHVKQKTCRMVTCFHFEWKKKIAELSTMCRSHLISYFGKEKYRFQFRARDAIVKFIIFCSVTARTEKTERLVQSSGHGLLI